jgi:precorrin-3B synthase
VTTPHRRGACPGLSAPMLTGDGLLVRLTPTESIPPGAFLALCEAARRHGNGTIEISARGSLQVRGLTPRSAPLFAAAVARLDIATHEDVFVIAGPLIEDAIAPIEAANAAAELRRALADARLALSPKVSVVVDGGGRLHLDAVSADIRLRAMGPAPQRYHVGLGGDGETATWLGSIAQHDAIDTVVSLLKVIAAQGPAARAADVLHAEGNGAFHSVLATCIAPSPPPSRRTPAEIVGLHPIPDGTFAVADALAELTRIAAAHGTQAVRPAPDRALLLIGVTTQNPISLTAAAEQRGFVVRAADPRRRIAACPGSPACASGLIPARALAAALAPTLESELRPARGGVAIHISGCLKGCAHPGPAALTVVGTERGCGIIRNGTARATPNRHVDPANLAAEISRIAAQAGEVAHG